MVLSREFLQSNPEYFFLFRYASQDTKLDFFQNLQQLASRDLSLAHSVFKISSVRTILTLADQGPIQQLASTNFVAGFSVYKPFDTLRVENNKVDGKKHWITNLQQSEFLIVQAVDHNNDIKLVFINLEEPQGVDRDFSFFKNPGMADTQTGDATFHDYACQPLFSKSDARYFASNNHNSLCFVANYLGATKGLLDYLDRDQSRKFKSQHKNLSSLLTSEISNTSGETVSSDVFWHQRNALYLDSKNLLAETCCFIIKNCAGNFYNLASPQGKHFTNCLIYSGHNGPITRSYQQLFTEPYDY